VHNAAFFNIPEQFSTILFKSSESKDFGLKDTILSEIEFKSILFELGINCSSTI
jgi:hypothetical protein